MIKTYYKSEFILWGGMGNNALSINITPNYPLCDS